MYCSMFMNKGGGPKGGEMMLVKGVAGESCKRQSVMGLVAVQET